MFVPCSSTEGRADGTGQAGSFQFGKEITVREQIRRHQNQGWKGGSKEGIIFHLFSK